MDSSFLLLSSMSPKINKTAKTVQPKTPRLLALKRNIRRSSNFDNVRHSLQLANSIISIKSGTTESISTENSVLNVLNATPIIISDSENGKDKVEEKSNGTEISAKSKFLTISDWVKDVNSQNHFISKNSCDTFNFNDVLNNLPKGNSSIERKSDRLSSSSESQISDSSDEFHTKLLDELYDGTWRNLKCDILPNSTTRKKNSTKTNRIIRTQDKAPISSCIKTLQDASEDNSDKIPVLLKLRFDSDESGSDKNSLSICKKGSRSCNSGRSCGSNVSDNSKEGKQRVKKTNNGLSNKVDNTKEKVKKNTKKCENTLVRTESLIFGKSNILKLIPVPEKSRSNSCQTFLASLSGSVKISQCDPSARLFRNNFKNFKNDLLTRLFKLYNEKVFDNKIHDDTPLEWNDKMRGTAGFCYCKKITRRTGIIERKARIVLSTKVVDACDRLRDTLIHEMCHAATWIINEVANGHGDYWKAWATKAIEIFPELPPIKRCHDYVINTKYTYQCMDCGYSIGRHSKSLDIERKRCGYCYGKFEVFVNKTNKEGETRSVPVTPKKPPTAFALFVKENYAVYKTPQLNHGQVMKLLGQKFSEAKVSL